MKQKKKDLSNSSEIMLLMQRETLRKWNKLAINYEVSRKNFQLNNLTELEVWYAHFLKRLTSLTVLIQLLFMLFSKYNNLFQELSDYYSKLYLIEAFVIVWINY